MSISKRNFLFFMKSPKFSDLLIVYLDINNCYKDEFDTCPETQFDFSKQKENRTQRILKCRQLIFSEENIIASPDYDRLQKIVAVIPKIRYNMPEFKERIQKMNLFILSCREVDTSVLEACIQYTAMAKMAPSWNVVNNLLVQGRDFLISNGRLTAVELNMSASENEIILCIKPLNVVIPHGR
ncbi:uncharacterized protein C18orf63-like, partial [Stegodyphus dumicola]|uniref:uncharacterized protein C18orf63-like n=1 Tax=Stegodyphus dumicola TaxID=202533 RepID=UPI0015B2EA9A